MKIFSLFLQVIFFASVCSIVSAQDSTSTAKEDFESYERNFSQVTVTPKPLAPRNNISTKPTASPGPGSVKTPRKTVALKNNTGSSKTNVSAATGLPGMKIWLEKQTSCTGAFSLVAPTSIFTNGDCVRVKFRLNFEGYLTIINRASSGSIDKIYPLKDQNNKISPKTDNLIPDNQGWEFFDQKGNENLFFIVSKLPLKNEIHREIENQEINENESSQPAEVYDRDLKPRTEKNEIFVLANETRLEKPLIFRLTLKHR